VSKKIVVQESTPYESFEVAAKAGDNSSKIDYELRASATDLPANIAKIADQVVTSWKRAAQAVISAGKHLIDAQNACKTPAEKERLEAYLIAQGLNSATISKLRTIASNPVLSDERHVMSLPSSYTTLYELSRIKSERKLAEAVAHGEICVEMTRKDAAQLRSRLNPQKQLQSQPSARPKPTQKGGDRPAPLSKVTFSIEMIVDRQDPDFRFAILELDTVYRALIKIKAHHEISINGEPIDEFMKKSEATKARGSK